jgi:Arc/MetJ-type ribon-helix-helix transcriptional regulator
MKTIAITIDEEALQLLDELTMGGRRRSRSALIRQAVGDFLQRERRRRIEEREAEILRKHRTRLSRDARALVRDQAHP